MTELREKQRDRLADKDFAFPEQRKEPLEDAAHVRNAVARFNQVEGVTDKERDAAWRRIERAAKKFDVELDEIQPVSFQKKIIQTTGLDFIANGISCLFLFVRLQVAIAWPRAIFLKQCGPRSVTHCTSINCRGWEMPSQQLTSSHRWFERNMPPLRGILH